MNKVTISKKLLREFGLVFGIGFPIFFGIVIPYIFGHNFRLWTFYFGLPFLIFGLTFPLALHYPYKIWMALGQILGYVNSRLILGIVFILVLLPISIIMKIFKYDPLKKNFERTSSYRIRNDKKEINFERIF